MISKELLSEMLGEQVVAIKKNNDREIIALANNLTRTINIHELAHKVKEWAWDNGYQIVTTKDDGYIADVFEQKDSYHSYDFTTLHQEYGVNTEPEAIFKAGAWILENR